MKLSFLAALLLPLTLAGEELQPATFDDLGLPPGSEWTHIPEQDYEQGSFTSGSFTFRNRWDSAWGSWAWFGYATHTDSSYGGTADQMHCAAGGGHDSAAYGVWFDSAYDGPSYIDIDPAVAPAVVPGVWVCANAWLKHAVLEGDGMSGPFTEGDYCCMMVRGEREGGTWAGPVRIMLADYTSSEPGERYIADTWRRADLSALGEVVRLHLEFFSTKRNGWGITTPSYACIDDLGSPEAGTSVGATTQSLRAMTEVYDPRGVLLYRGEGMPQLPSGLYLVVQGGDRRMVRL